MDRSRRAFTLVEFLVVIGIIVIVMSMLLPAVSRARAAARASTCASNIRQLQLAAINYAVDNAGYLPPAHLFFITKNLDRWHGTRPTMSKPFDFNNSRLKPYLQVASIKQCPEFEPLPGGFENSAGGYGYNDQYLGSSMMLASGSMSAVKLDTDFGNRPARMAMIHSPARTICFTDAAIANPNLVEYSFAEPPLQSDGSQSTPSIHFRHHGRANIAWLDGHVSSEEMTWTYPVGPPYFGDNEKMSLGFFGPKDNSLFDRQ